MVRLMVILVSLLFLQSASCTVRDQRHVSIKLAYITKVVPIISQEITSINTHSRAEKEAMQFLAETYVTETTLAESIFKHGIQNNTQDNEQGRELQAFLLNALGFIQSLRETLQKDNVQLQQNLIGGVEAFLNFVPPTKEMLTEAKLSSKNSELTINSIMIAIDRAVAIFCKLKTIVDNKKTSNSELRIKIKQIFPEVFNTLNKIPFERYNFRELVSHSRQLKFLIRQLSSNTKNLLKVMPIQSGFKTVVEKTFKKLETIENDIQQKVHSKTAFSLLQNLYRGWLSKIIEIAEDLDNQAKEHKVDIRRVLLDTLGIVELYGIEFQILTGKIF